MAKKMLRPSFVLALVGFSWLFAGVGLVVSSGFFTAPLNDLGDFVAGWLAVPAFLAMIYAVYAQSQELALQRAEQRRQADAVEQQQASSALQLELAVLGHLLPFVERKLLLIWMNHQHALSRYQATARASEVIDDIELVVRDLCPWIEHEIANMDDDCLRLVVRFLRRIAAIRADLVASGLSPELLARVGKIHPALAILAVIDDVLANRNVRQSIMYLDVRDHGPAAVVR
ncbi:MAG: hypothetical protein HQL38_07430 [Alphaproteobacteria bacterium]|nr:hypothetical protein [Alphaproteobacteria bacterium]